MLADAQPAALFAPASLAVVLADALAAELLTLLSDGLCQQMPDLPGSTLGFGGLGLQGHAHAQDQVHEPADVAIEI